MKTLYIFFLLLIADFIFIPQSIAQVNQGDTMSFWSVTYIDWPPLVGTPQKRIHATCERAGAHCYLFVEDGVTLPQPSLLDTMVHRFDDHFVPELTAVYGPVPDALDADSHVYIVIYDDPNWCGYFDPAQQMTDSFVYSHWGSHSSEHEIIYVASGCFYSIIDITAHEFGHLLHWQQDHSPEPPSNPVKYWEDAWIDEGFSTFAAMYLTEDIYQPDVLDNFTFFTQNPDIPLIYFSDYNQVKLWSLFMFEHYGGWNYISALISNQLNGIAGMDSALRQINSPADFNEAFVHWSVTNYLDDSDFEGGKYAYHHYNVYHCHITSIHSSFPTGLCHQAIHPYGTDYISFTSLAPKPIHIDFSGDSTSKFRLAALKINLSQNTTVGVDFINPDANGHAVINADSLGLAYNRLILVVCNIDSALHENDSATYSYSTSSVAGIEDHNDPGLVQIYPNPLSGNVYCTISPVLKGSEYKIFNIDGRMISTGKLKDENNILDMKNAPAGVYLFSIENKFRQTFRLIKE